MIEFIKTDIFHKDLSKTLHRAFELRQKSDYMENVEVTKENVEEIRIKAQDFVNKIERYLSEKI